jgi:ribosomal protein S18 acetylase RimI-like enzyme
MALVQMMIWDNMVIQQTHPINQAKDTQWTTVCSRLWQQNAMIISLSNQQTGHSGPRPVNLRRDARQIFQLLDVAFGQSLDRASRRTLDSHLSAANSGFYVPPILGPRNFISGFVWEEHERIIGNVSIMRTRSSERCLVANVAVHPSYRRQGIAHSLMAKAIDHIREQGASVVLLQVKEDNKGAQELYHSLNFETVGSTTHWRLGAGSGKSLTRENPGIRPLQRHEWQAAYKLDVASMKPDLNWPDPLTEDAYKGGFWQWLGGLFGGRQEEHWVTTGAQGKLTGLGGIRSQLGQRHQLWLRVAPAYRGQLERALLAKLLRRLPTLSYRGASLDHPADDALTNQLLQEALFRPDRTLVTMRLDVAGK